MLCKRLLDDTWSRLVGVSFQKFSFAVRSVREANPLVRFVSRAERMPMTLHLAPQSQSEMWVLVPTSDSAKIMLAWASGFDTVPSDFESKVASQRSDRRAHVDRWKITKMQNPTACGAGRCPV
jgi:hypothetical protein